MKKLSILMIAVILLGGIMCSCGGSETPTTAEQDPAQSSAVSDTVTDTQGGSDTPDSPDTPGSAVNSDPDYRINSFYDLNSNSNEILSHAGDTGYAGLELDYRSLGHLDVKDLKTSTVYYPRVKLMADGNYIMFYQYGEHGNTVYYITSSDLVEWSAPTELFVYEKDKDIMYATCDAVVLDNGEILAVCSYREGSTYDVNPHLNGVVMKKSSDNGKTWSEQKKIYVGTTWEPYPMQLSSGEVQVYFTNTTCYYKTAVADASTGTAMVRSYDKGETWTGNLNAPYSGQIVSQTATRVSAGKQLYSDQMPVGIELLGSGKLMLALETRLDKSGNYRITLSYSSDNWKTPLGTEQTGPAEKIEKAWTGAAPYVRQFVSGEVVVGYTRSGLLAYRMLDSDGKNYTAEEYKPFEGISKSYWGSLEIIDSHTVVGIGETFKEVTVTRTENTVDYGKLNLNHTISAKTAAPAVDGDASDWAENDEALFVGSNSQAQASVRVTRDDENVYFLVERLDYYLGEKNDTVMIYFSDSNMAGYFRLTVGCGGVEAFERFDGKKFTSLDTSALRCGKKVNGTVGNDSDTDLGYSIEVAVPLGSIEQMTDMCVALNLANSDNGKKSTADMLAGIDMTRKETWIKVNID